MKIKRLSLVLLFFMVFTIIQPIGIALAEEMESIRFGEDSNFVEIMHEYYSQKENEPSYPEQYTAGIFISFANWVFKTLGMQDVTLLVFGKNTRADKSDGFLTGGCHTENCREDYILGIFPTNYFEAIAVLYNLFERQVPIPLVIALILIAMYLMIWGGSQEGRSRSKDYLLAFLLAILAFRFGHYLWIIIFEINYFIVDLVWYGLQSYGVKTGLFLDMIWGNGKQGYDSLTSIANNLGVAFIVVCAAIMTFLLNYQYSMRFIMLSILLITFPIVVALSVFPKFRHSMRIWWDELIGNTFMQSAHAIALGFFFFLIFLGGGGALSSTEQVTNCAEHIDIYVDKRKIVGHIDMGKTLAWTSVHYRGDRDYITNVPVSLYVDGQLRKKIYISKIENGKYQIAEFRGFDAEVDEKSRIVTSKIAIVANPDRAITECAPRGDVYSNNGATNDERNYTGVMNHSINFFIILAYFFGLPTIVSYFRQLVGLQHGNSFMSGIGAMMGVYAVMNMARMFRPNNSIGTTGAAQAMPHVSNAGSAAVRGTNAVAGRLATRQAPLVQSAARQFNRGRAILGNNWVRRGVMGAGMALGATVSTMASGNPMYGMVAGAGAGHVISRGLEKVGGTIDKGINFVSDMQHSSHALNSAGMDMPVKATRGDGNNVTVGGNIYRVGQAFSQALQQRYMQGDAGFLAKATVNTGWAVQRMANVLSSGKYGKQAVARQEYITSNQELYRQATEKMQILQPQLQEAKVRYDEMKARYGKGSEWYALNVDQRTGKILMPDEYIKAEREYHRIQADYSQAQGQAMQAQKNLTNFQNLRQHLNNIAEHNSSSKRGMI